MKTRYYVCGLGYDKNDYITGYKQDFGDFDTYVEAYELFVKLQCRDEESFFTKEPEIYQLLIQLEECEETDDEINCIDVKNEWRIINPNLRRKTNMKHYAYNSPFKMKDKDGVEYTLTVEQDDMATNPRDWDNVCTIVCFHRNYSLGDKHNYDNGDEFFEDILHNICGMKYENFEELSTREKYKLACESDKVYIQELNLYDHSGLTISTSSCYPYNDRWDAGCVGWIYVSKERALEEWYGIPEKDENGEFIRIPHEHPDGGVTYSTKYTPITEENWKEVAEYHMDNEVEVYDQYLRGDVYGFKLTKKVIEQDKCPHCNEVIREYEVDEDVDSCWDFYGDCIEENGIIDYLGDLEFVEED